MRWRTGRGVLLGALALSVVAAAGGLVYARPLLKTGTGYAAHNACAVRLVAGRGPGAAAQDLPDNPLVPYLRTDVERDAGTARSSILGVLYPQTAYYTPGYGCTVAENRPALSAVRPAAGVTTTGPNAASGLDTSGVASIDAAVDAAFGVDGGTRARLNTRAVVVVHQGRLVTERYADGFTADTRQLGWSMTKSVTNLMAGRLVQQGRLSLSEKGLRPEWTDERADITVEQLLRMTSGLAWDETYALGTPITRMLYLEEDMGGYAASLPAVHSPGTYQQYSSGTTNILCQLLQERSGMGTDIASQLIFTPLGMSSAVLEPDATGHPVCSSYLWATPRDWAAIGQFALQEGRWNGQDLLPEGWMGLSTATREVESEEDGFGAHWWANRRPDGSLSFPGMPADTYWASGHDGQRVFVVPSADLVVVRMGFTPAEVDLGVDRLVADLAAAVEASPAARE